MKKSGSLFLIVSLMALSFIGCSQKKSESIDTENSSDDRIVIELDGDTASIDGQEISEYDYQWHCDRTAVHDEVDGAPSEYYTGTLPEETGDIYIDRDLKYYPETAEEDFQLVDYDGEKEWACYYADGENDEFIWATLPFLGNELPSDMMHSEEEAAENKVLHITAPGEYVLTGKWKGQILVDLGDDAFSDETAKVTLILNNADIECTVAPGVIFKNVYECDNAWEDRSEYGFDVDTSEAGAVIVIKDGTENIISGENVFRMLKPKYKNEEDTSEVKTQKKLRKTDGALYSYMTMNIYGEESGDGKLTVNSGYEGIDSELHLSVFGGIIEINSQDDGMNVNEDNVSIIAFYGGELTINAALGAEGDGVDSNGFVKIDGGTINVNGIRVPDSAIDSENGIYYSSGNINVDGEDITPEEGSVTREISGGMGIRNPDGMPGFENGERPEGNMGSGNGERPDMPKDENGPKPGDMPEKPEGDMKPEMGEKPEGMEIPEGIGGKQPKTDV